jgi:sensor domain CHASE-containing protein
LNAAENFSSLSRSLDGVFVADSEGQPVFRALGHLKTDEVADVVQITKVRVLRALERRGVVRVSPEALEVDEAFAARDPVLAQLAAAAVAGLPPAGPVRGADGAAGSGP